MPRALRSSQSELTEFAARSTDAFARAFFALGRARAREAVGLTADDLDRALERCATTIAQTMTLADLYGRRRLWLEVDAAADLNHEEQHESMFAATSASPVVPNVPFTEAFQGILAREPRLAPHGDLVAQVYRDRVGFALARSADVALTARIRDIVARSIREGRETQLAAAAVQRESADFTRSYADTVYRTNLSTAYAAGRFEQAQEPGVRQVLPAMERWEVIDSTTRRGRPEDHGENHAPVHGLVMDTRDPRWTLYAPPAGYRCRGGVRMMSRAELARRGLLEGRQVVPFLPPGLDAYSPHPRFGQRNPRSLVYGGTS